MKYDVAIAGGGLAGLSLSIQLAKKGYSTVLFEKESYPFHKVCGEYISMESWNYLDELGLDLLSMDLPRISRLQVSSVSGKLLQQMLPLGGFGISRYSLDQELSKIAVKAGVVLKEGTAVNSIRIDNNEFIISTSEGDFQSGVTIGSYGKRSRLDLQWKRPFIIAKKSKLNNYVGVKYHIDGKYRPDTISLHIFKDGYCGLSMIENKRFNLCYMTAASNLQLAGGDIHKMEQTILSENPHLKKIFSETEKIRKDPVTISQISFDKKTQVEDHVLMAGDSAGMITPLCGNGMSMALHASKLLSEIIPDHVEKKISREKMEERYKRTWQKHFASRLRTGRIIQRMFGSKWSTDLLIRTGKIFPFITKALIRSTHGKPF